MITQIGYVPEDKRWKATIVYQVTETETRTQVYDIWELEELQDLIENGPTFCSIRSFNISYVGAPPETIKEAKEK